MTNLKGKIAAEDYKTLAAEIKIMSSQFLELLAAHETKQAQHPKDWGYVGDLQHTKSLLNELLGSVKGGA